MPNKLNRDKRSSGSGGGATDRPNDTPADGPNGGKRRPTRRKRPTLSPLSAAALLSRSDALLPQLTQQLALQQSWHAWLAARLPEPLPGKLAGVVERDGVLTVLGSSAAWAARLRYAVAEMEADIRAHAPALRVIRVRVMPRP